MPATAEDVISLNLAGFRHTCHLATMPRQRETAIITATRIEQGYGLISRLPTEAQESMKPM